MIALLFTFFISGAWARDILVASKTPLVFHGQQNVGYTYHAPEGHRLFAIQFNSSFDQSMLEFPYVLTVYSTDGNLVEVQTPLTLEDAWTYLRPLKQVPDGTISECNAILAHAPGAGAPLALRLADDLKSFEVLRSY